MTFPDSMRRAALQEYHTALFSDENPVFQNGLWVCGSTTGAQWHDMQVSGGILCGTQDGTFDGTNFRDSVGLLSQHSWGPNQMVWATIHQTNRNNTALSETELWLRGKGGLNSWRGYECALSMRSAGQYSGITRWNGALNSFDTMVNGPANITVNDGDVLMAMAVGPLLSVYITQVDVTSLVCSVDIRTVAGTNWFDGDPGAGHWRHDNGATGILNTDNGFTSLQARTL